MAKTRISNKRLASKATRGVNLSGPYNIQHHTKKQQSINDKLTHLKSLGINGKAARKMAKTGRKMNTKRAIFNKGTLGGSTGGGGGKPNTYSRKPKEVKLPSTSPTYSETPWFKPNFKTHNEGGIDVNTPIKIRGKGGKKSPSSRRNKNASQVLPGSFYDISDQSITALNTELLLFAKYIRLSNKEIKARNGVVDYITDLSQTLWGEEVKVQPFGSFATLDVCTFSSDIDLALWNVVEAEEEEDDEIGVEYKFDEGNIVMSESSLMMTMNALKRERVDDWKKAFEEVDKTSLREEEAFADVSPVDNSSTSSSSVPHVDEGHRKATLDSTSLFIIDREAVDVEIDTSDADETPSAENEDKKTIHKLAEKSHHPEDWNHKEVTLQEQKCRGKGLVETTSSGGGGSKSGQKSGQIEREENNADSELEFKLDKKGIEDFGGDDVSVQSEVKTKREVIEIDSSDDDESIDKMDSFHRRNHASKMGRTPAFSDPRQKGVIQLSSESDSDWAPPNQNTIGSSRESTDNDEDAFEVNLSTNKVDYAASAASRKTIGPSGESRKKVLKALALMGKRLRKAPFSRNIHVRKHARVPIICMTTRSGFDTDIALGGHNGTDTSHYVRKLVDKYGKNSFATVVLFLKILLQQADLDKPFSGGLGSYRLYVLVANHFNMHTSLGGGDSAAEMMVSFFFRYSTPTKSNNKARSYLCTANPICSEGGEADLGPVDVKPITQLFQLCYQRIMDRLGEYKDKASSKSILAAMVDSVQVKRERIMILNKSKGFNDKPTVIPLLHPGKVSISAKRMGHTFSKSKLKQDVSKSTEATSNSSTSKRKSRISPKRSPRGALIPKFRPDAQIKSNGANGIIERGQKNRKNKKKQRRDQALGDFCRLNSLRSSKMR